MIDLSIDLFPGCKCYVCIERRVAFAKQNAAKQADAALDSITSQYSNRTPETKADSDALDKFVLSTLPKMVRKPYSTVFEEVPVETGLDSLAQHQYTARGFPDRSSECEQGQGYPPFNNNAVPALNFRAEFEKRFPSINYKFIETMEEVGGLGRAKYGENCIEARIGRGDTSRYIPRIHAREIAKHACNHFGEYLDGIKHDVFKTKRHQLAAAAFNPMMEFSLAELEGEK